MVSNRTALQGRTVYGAGSYAPTKGRVSAQGQQGYINRSVRQGVGTQPLGGVRRVGSDGQSDTRSGLAAAALARQQALQGANKNPYQNQGRQNAAAAQHPHHAHQAMAAQAQAAQAQAQQSAIPSVTVNANGQLELPYSADWSANLIGDMADVNDQLGQMQLQQQQENATWQQNQRQAGIDYGNTQRGTLNRNAGAGTAFSSAYGVQAGNDANDYQNQLNQLLADHNAQSMAFDTERTSLINAFKQRMQQAALERADKAAEEAGTLGYGRDKAKNKPGRNTSAHQAGQNKNNQGGQGKKNDGPKGKKK